MRSMIYIPLVLFLATLASAADVSALQRRPDVQAAVNAATEREPALELWRKLALTNAPSGHEDDRAAIIVDFLKQNGYPDAFRDRHGNVVSTPIKSGAGAIVFEAHMDTVVQPGVKITITEGKDASGATWAGPAVGDDVTGVVGLMKVAQALHEMKFQPKRPVVFVFSCNEEGGGTSEGAGGFIADNKGALGTWIGVDGSPIDPLGAIADYGTGSYSLRVVFHGPGVHTIESYGQPSTTRAMAMAIERLYEFDIPQTPLEKRTWLNIGFVSAGTVPNAMAKEAKFALDLRSNDATIGRALQQQAIDIIERAAKEAGVKVEYTKRQRDPVHLDTPGQKQLVEVLQASYRAVGIEPEEGKIGSSDYIRALMNGIPAAGIGITEIKHMHSPEEETEVEPLFQGIRQVLLAAVALGEK